MSLVPFFLPGYPNERKGYSQIYPSRPTAISFFASVQLFFEGEDNPAISPATSPKTSPPQVTLPSRQDSDAAHCKVPSAIDRKVTGLKNALGFKVGVKRVRLYLKGWPPEGGKNKVVGEPDF